MPIMDGWATTEAFRNMMKKREIPTIPIVGLTAFTGTKEIEKCYSAGMI